MCTQEAKADLVFLVDGSASIGLKNFQQIREFLMSVVKNFEIAPNKVRVGMVQFSDTPKTEFFLNTYEEKQEILDYIKNLPYKTGGTYTGDALKFLLKNHFVEAAGSRANQMVPQIAFVITDGSSQDEVEPHAQELRQKGVKVYAIGIKDADEKFLKKLASQPYNNHVYSVSDFNALQEISLNVGRELCTTVEEAQGERQGKSSIWMFWGFFIIHKGYFVNGSTSLKAFNVKLWLIFDYGFGLVNLMIILLINFQEQQQSDSILAAKCLLTPVHYTSWSITPLVIIFL